MWLPIIHNLSSNSPAYAAAQHYNALVGNKPKGNGTLAQKLAAVSVWQHKCSKALDAVGIAYTEGEVLEVSVDAMPPAKFDENLPVIKGV